MDLIQKAIEKGYIDNYITAKTQELAYYYTLCDIQKWLREIHNINIAMYFKPNVKKWDFMPYSMSMRGHEFVKYNSEYFKIHGNERRYIKYEEALENGITESLEML